jgi:hypothetical protein
MDQLALFPDIAVTGTGRPFPWPKAVEPEPETETTPVDTGQLTFGEEDGVAAFDSVTFEFEGQQKTGMVIARYESHGHDRVTVGVESGAVYCLRADAVTPAGGGPE